MITTLIVLACVLAYASIGAFVGQKLQNAHSCNPGPYDYCEYMGGFFGGIFWPIALPIAVGIALANKEPKRVTSLRKIEELEREAGIR